MSRAHGSASAKALQGPLDPSAHLGSSHSDISLRTTFGRDSINNILKLVNIPECQRFSVMRPAIVPVSETGPEITTLNFQDLDIAQPSLPRNKWSWF